MERGQNGHIEAELVGHNRRNVWFRIATGENSYKVLTYPADIVTFKAGEVAKGTMVSIATDNAEVTNSAGGFRLVGGIFEVELVK